jgi:hypothetical protein
MVEYTNIMKCTPNQTWPSSMVQLPWSDLFKKSIYKIFGPLTGWKSNVDQEGNDHEPKSEHLDFFNTCLKRAV